MILVIGMTFAVILNAVHTARHKEDSKRGYIFIATLALTIVGLCICQEMLNHLATLIPVKLDLYVYRWDGLFGQPSFAIGQFLLRHRALQTVAFEAYGCLPLAMILAFAAQLYRSLDPSRLIWAFVLNLLLALPIY